MTEKTQATENRAHQESIEEYLSKERNSLDQEYLSDDRAKKKKKILKIGALLLSLILIFAYISYSTGQKSFANEKVSLSIEKPENIESGKEINLTIGYENDNDVELRSARLEIFLPNNFTLSSSDKPLKKDGDMYYWETEKIPGHSTDRIRIFGKMLGSAGETRDIRALIKYRPANFNSEFQADARTSLTITSVPIELSLKTPEEGVKNETDTVLQFIVKNKSDHRFSKSRLDIELPESFDFVSSESAVTEKENRYSFETGEMNPEDEKIISVLGSFHSEGEKETVKMEFYAPDNKEIMEKYGEKSEEIQIIKPEISVTTKINGSEEYFASKNEELEYSITFKNQSDKEIRGLSLTSSLSGNFDLDSIKAEGGKVNGNEITWSALNVPALGQLKAGEEGGVSFKVKVKDYFDISKESDKDFVLENTVVMKTSSKEIVSITESAKIKAFLALDVKGYFNDDGRIQNGGSLPPRVGEKTYYTIHWSIRSLFSATKDIKIKATLPQGIRWTGKYVDSKGKVLEGEFRASSENPASEAESITQEKVYYDSNTNEMIWEIPALKANEGIISAAKEIIFQIEAIPRESDAEKTMDLLNISTASGYDTFTEQAITGSKDKITSRLADDYSIGDNESIVQKR